MKVVTCTLTENLILLKFTNLQFRNKQLKLIIFFGKFQGNICGWNEMSELPFLMIFDLTECLNPGAVVTGCNSPQVKNSFHLYLTKLF